jgi:hypothetical protein
MRGEELERVALPQHLLQPVSVQMFHLRYLSMPMPLQIGEMDYNNKEKYEFRQFCLQISWFHTDVCTRTENSPIMAFKAPDQYWENSTFDEGINGRIAV